MDEFKYNRNFNGRITAIKIYHDSKTDKDRVKVAFEREGELDLDWNRYAYNIKMNTDSNVRIIDTRVSIIAPYRRFVNNRKCSLLNNLCYCCMNKDYSCCNPEECSECDDKCESECPIFNAFNKGHLSDISIKPIHTVNIDGTNVDRIYISFNYDSCHIQYYHEDAKAYKNIISCPKDTDSIIRSITDILNNAYNIRNHVVCICGAHIKCIDNETGLYIKNIKCYKCGADIRYLDGIDGYAKPISNGDFIALSTSYGGK